MYLLMSTCYPLEAPCSETTILTILFVRNLNQNQGTWRKRRHSSSYLPVTRWHCDQEVLLKYYNWQLLSQHSIVDDAISQEAFIYLEWPLAEQFTFRSQRHLNCVSQVTAPLPKLPLQALRGNDTIYPFPRFAGSIFCKLTFANSTTQANFYVILKSTLYFIIQWQIWLVGYLRTGKMPHQTSCIKMIIELRDKRDRTVVSVRRKKKQ